VGEIWRELGLADDVLPSAFLQLRQRMTAHVIETTKSDKFLIE
jgi:hypothetical protein